MSLSNDATLTMPVAPAYTSGCYGNGNSMFGGDWAAWILLFVIFGAFGGGWGNGFGGGFGGNGGGVNGPGFQGWATRADINEGFALNNLQSGINGIQQGICASTYALNTGLLNGFNSVQSQLADCCCTTQRAIDNVGFQNAQGMNNISNQIASCCCDTQRSIDNVRYDMATQACDTRNTIQNTTRDIIDNQNANSRAILDFLTQEKLDSLRTELSQAQAQLSQAQQTNNLINALRPCPTPAYLTCNPWASQAAYGSCGSYGNCGCGC